MHRSWKKMHANPICLWFLSYLGWLLWKPLFWNQCAHFLISGWTPYQWGVQYEWNLNVSNFAEWLLTTRFQSLVHLRVSCWNRVMCKFDHQRLSSAFDLSLFSYPNPNPTPPPSNALLAKMNMWVEIFCSFQTLRQKMTVSRVWEPN